METQKYLRLRLDEKLNFKGYLERRSLLLIKNLDVEEIDQLPSTLLVSHPSWNIHAISFRLRWYQ